MQIPSGSLSLDVALGVYRKLDTGHWQTGLPARRIIEVFGPEGSGKTTLVGQFLANAQQVRPKDRVAIIDTEHALDPSWFKKLGVNWDTCQLIQPDSGEEALDIMVTLLKTGAYSAIALDSVAARLPQSEADGNIGDSHVALQARLMSQAMRIIVPEMTRPDVNTNLIFTNQERDTIGGFGGKVTPGGRALKFYASFRVKVWRGQGSTIKEGEQQTGHVMSCQFIKNKVAPPYRTALVPLVYGHGIDNEMSLFDLCKDHDIVDAKGSWYSFGAMRLGQGRTNQSPAVQ